jgi:hypothetical protein
MIANAILSGFANSPKGSKSRRERGVDELVERRVTGNPALSFGTANHQNFGETSGGEL